ncbi:MAG: TonB-dependent receptor [Flavobacteriia bacterium]|nr:TonB-dependent receptor [Flavobacteriia bacterium]
MTLRLGQSQDESRNLNNGVLSTSYKTAQTQYQFQNDIRLPLGMALLAFERVDQQVVSTDAYSLKERAINSALAGWTGSFGSHRLQANFRQDHNTQFGVQSTGMLGYGFQWSSNWRSSVSWGTAFKTPTFNDLYYPADADGSVGNANLKPEKSLSREASVHYETDLQHSSATYYQNEVTNLIQWDPIDPTFVTTFGYTPSNVSNAKLSGWTFAHKQELGNYQFMGSLDLQDPNDQTLNKTLIYRAREIIKLGLSRNMSNLSIGGELQSNSKRYADKENTIELGGYTLMNLRAQYKLNQEWSFFARANNIFDKKFKFIAKPEKNIPMILLIRAKQSCISSNLLLRGDEGGGVFNSSKINSVIDLIGERIGNGNGKIVFCDFHEEMDIIEKRLGLLGLGVGLGCKIGKIDSRVKKNDRERLLNDRFDVLIIQINSGSEGLNLQENYSEVYFVSPHWNPSIEDQAIGRCYRFGQKKCVSVFRFEMDGFDDEKRTLSVERHISNIQNSKRAMIKELF